MKEYANQIMNMFGKLGLDIHTSQRFTGISDQSAVKFDDVVSVVNGASAPYSNKVIELGKKAIKSMEAVKQFQANQLDK
jgi:hypothetical protein